MLPKDFDEKMKKLLKDEYDDYLSSFNNPSVKSLRINTSKISVDDFLSIFPYKLESVPWTSDGFYFEDENVSKDINYYAGLFYLQEASAMLPAELLPIDEGDLVLDCCAAPGGKSLKLLSKLNNTGLLVSNDISASRANALLRNIERQGYSNFFVTINDTKTLLKKYPQTFDKILVDAPCSGEGMFRKEKHLIKDWTIRGNDYYSNIQKEIVDDAYKMLKDGGIMVYSTCTFDESEDEDIIQYLLDKYNDLKLLPIKKYPGFKDGKNNIGIKLFPHLIKGEGHYVCLLQKGDEKNNNNNSKYLVSKPEFNFFKYIKKDFYNGEFTTINDHLYFVPKLNTQGIRVLRSGLLLGELRNNELKPSTALALNLKRDDFLNVIDLNEELANKYLKGETIMFNSSINTYVLVCYKKQPLGFGKINNGQIKNLLDKGWIKR